MPKQEDHQGQEEEGITREQMSAVLDHFGWYQKRLFLFMTLPLIMSGYTTMSVLLIFVTPDHRCQVPGLDNDTFSIQNDAHRKLVNFSIPMTSHDGELGFSKCDMYKDGNTNVIINGTHYGDTKACDTWVYDDTDFDNTIATQFDLVCEEKGFRAIFNMMYMLGLLVGSSVSGLLCDRLGRKKMFLVGLNLSILVVILTAFPGVRAMLLVYRFLTSSLNMISYMGLYVLILEFMGTEKRTLAGSLTVVIWIIGPFMVGGLSYVLRDWRWLQVLNGAPFVVCISYWWLLDESPVWLHSKGRVKEARKVILKIMKINKITLPDDTPAVQEYSSMEHTDHTTADKTKQDIQVENNKDKKTDTDEGKTKTAVTDKEGETLTDNQQRSVTFNVDKEKKEEKESKEEKMEEKEGEAKQSVTQQTFLGLLKYPNLIARTGIIFFNWCAISTTYYGLSLNVANLGGDIRQNFFFSNLTELVGVCIAWLLLDRLGRKRTHCAGMLLSGCSCLATIFSVMMGSSDLQWLTILLVMIGKLGISASFATIYLMSGELFPTVIRNQGMGFSSTVARVASALAPYIADLSLHIEGNVGKALPLVIFGALALTAGLLALCLPETLHRKLPDTILEAAHFTKKQSGDLAHVQQTAMGGKNNP